jgi:ppGpp synthetase/RelA/SpoT-type nucleotidyltranferase
MRALNDFNIHQKDFDYAQENFEIIKREHLLPQFKTKKDSFPENEKNINHMQLRTKTSISNKKPIYFTMDSRIKEKERVIIKMLSNSKYNSSKAIADIYGMRCKTKNKTDALLLLEYHWQNFP